MPRKVLLERDRAAYPVAVGAVAAGHAMPLERTLPAYLNAFLANLVSVGVRLIPIGQNAGQRILAALHPLIADTARRAAGSSLDDLGSATIALRHRIDAARRTIFASVPHMSSNGKTNGPLRVGIGGPVGAGKTTLTEMLCKAMRDRYSVAVVTNDIYTKEDALILNRVQALPEERILGVETGGCPHTAIREDASINLQAIAEMRKRFPDLDVIFIESGGDNLAATFSPELADITIYVIDVAGGEKVPRKGGPGDHPLRPPGRQQDRPRALCRRRSRRDGIRYQEDARRASLRLRRHASPQGPRPHRRIHREGRRAFR